MRTLVVAHARPFVGPDTATAITVIDVQEPGHGNRSLCAEAIVAARNELNISTITQVLKLLSNLGSNVLVARIEIAKMPLEDIDLIEREISLA
jgi:hypothetical protein